MQDGEPWWVASDVAQALEYRDASNMVRNLDEEDKGTHNLSTIRGDTPFQVINESGLYSAILKSRKQSAKRFKKWVTGEVLPTIRKTGNFGSVPAPVNLSDASALRGLLLGYTEQVLQLEHKISEDRPKVEYYQKVRESVNTESIGNFAKKLEFGERKLFKWLREQKILMADNSPYQRHIDEGHFKVLDKTTDKNGKTISYSQTVLTGKGKTYVQKRLAKAGNPDLSE
jgi:prophage antirepressor-like protein